MAIDIKMPALSPTMEEGSLARWLVKVGDTVSSGDVMAEIETDKATMEFEAVDEGVIAEILIEEGSEGVKVGAVIARLAVEGEEAAPAPAPAAEAAAVEGPAATPTARKLAEVNGIDLSSLTGTGPKGKITKEDVEGAIAKSGGAPVAAPATPAPAPAAAPAASGERIIASPLAKRIAADRGIDLALVKGTGPNGRIVKDDVENFTPAAAASQAPAATPAAPPAPVAVPTLGGDLDAPYEVQKLNNVRKVIARRLTEAKQTIPHIYLTVDIRLDALLKLRGELNKSLEADGVKLSVNDLLIKALARALQRVPKCNVSFQGDTLLQFTRQDISVAVAAPSGLITPIIRDAGRKGLAEISTEMKALANKAKDGKLQPHEFQGGTASLSNLGMFGTKQFDAVINPPQAMILAVGAGEQRPWVEDGQIVPATVMSATGSFDHRAIDGADGAQLMEALKNLVENPMGLVV
ncbi:pyruvate dehydrogenase complex dihydrolipoamide acetyltransferase [Porphyrobacter sp. HT-58-2]|uniref:2-oxo acid dehydrogenase subunit E2 n=1 Tax=Porphyrobacter sp. HT-58-2 TaxID=2023229 RepID=UPI000CDC3AFF|nr:2-oxo acid dehydrogenase subunit E2 [Porphyrobacter sp. HT-58-2]AUX69951.1 pyruvate dehydrogenase complex dihydrolipoamide acetyltransferase [Porphyrobacter sp. HT-58-2]